MNININVAENPRELGKRAARQIANLLKKAVAEQGQARIILSTGMSQFETIEALVQEALPWQEIEMFHLDEYIGLSESHPASFRKYLKERFLAFVKPKAVHLVNGEGDIASNIAKLSAEIQRLPVDVGVIGIGENAHIAFNDPPANFTTKAPFIVVSLDEKCRKQQVGEGWFKSIEEVPEQAISMSVSQMLSCKHIVTAAPHAVKAEAIYNSILSPVKPGVPASILKQHPSWYLYLDKASASKLFHFV